jgi:predicted PurR-regulated permease PerM
VTEGAPPHPVPPEPERPGPSTPPAPDVEELVEQVADRVEDDVERTVEDAAQQARAAEAGAEDAQAGAEQAREGAVEAGEAAVEAASVVHPDDPLLDTAVRKIEAQVTPDRPFGVPGRPTNPRSPFRIAFSAALGVALAYLLVQAVVAVRSVLVLLLISAFLAIGLNPAVEAMERRGLRRSLAVTVVLVATLLLFAGFVLAVVPPIVDQAQQFADKAPQYLNDLQGNRRISELDGRFHLIERARSYLDRPEQVGTTVFGGIFGVGKVVFSAAFSTLTVLILTLYFLSSLPAIKEQAYRLLPRSRRARVGLLTDEILTRVGGYVGGALTIAALAGGTTFIVLEVLSVPYPVALAIVVAVTDLVPLIGATIGAVAVTAVALFVSVRTGLVVGVYYLAYQQLENYVIYPRVMKRSVDVSPAATVVAVLVGGSLLGVLGALLAIPITAAVQLVLEEVVAPRQDTA